MFEEEFDTLYEEDSDSPRYGIAASEVYRELRNQGFRGRAVEVNQYLDSGDVEAAEELTAELLEADNGGETE